MREPKEILVRKGDFQRIDPPGRSAQVSTNLLCIGVVLGNAGLLLTPHAAALPSSLVIYNLVLLGLSIYFSRWIPAALALAGALLAGPFSTALAG